ASARRSPDSSRISGREGRRGAPCGARPWRNVKERRLGHRASPSGPLRIPQEVDEDFQGRPHLPAPRVIKVEAFERWRGPVVENGDDTAIGKHRRKIHTRELQQAQSIRYGADGECAVIDDQRAVHLDLEASPLAAETPRQKHAAGKPDADAIVPSEILRGFGYAALRQVS